MEKAAPASPSSQANQFAKQCLAEALVRLMEERELDDISVTDICTCCNAGRLFSHRATGGMRGNNMAAIMLNPAEEER